MATLLNTLLASLFSALFGAHLEIPVTSTTLEAVEVTVNKEPKADCDLKIYFYQAV